MTTGLNSGGFDSTDIDRSASSTPDMAAPPEHEHHVADLVEPARWRSAAETVVLYAACIAAALLLSGLLVEATGGSASAVYSALLEGSIGGPGRIGTTIGVAVPILVVALGTIISNRAGLVNIGQEGQLYIGAACGAYVGSRLGGPGPVVVLCLLAAAIVGGALWAGIAAALKYRRNVPEVLTTLLLVTIAVQLVGYGLKNQWLLLAPREGRANRQQIGRQLASDTRIPRITIVGNELPISAGAAIVITLLVGGALAYTIWGFRLRMLGYNPRTAQRAGVDAGRYGGTSLLLSGGFAGLAGGMMLAGGDFGNYTLVPGFASGIGWTGLLVALVARQRTAAAVLISFVFAGLRTGSSFVAATGVERRITAVIQGLLVLALLVPPALLFLRERRRAMNARAERA